MNISKEQIEKALCDLLRLRVAINAIPSIRIQCPNHPREYTASEADQLILVFCRHSLRTLYYAKNVLDHLLNLEAIQDDADIGHVIVVPVRDEVFFDFDAFVFSAKSIFSQTMLKRADALHKDAAATFRQLAFQAKRNLIDPLLNNVRNEIVHLNVYGSSIGSVAMLTNLGDRWGVQIFTTFYTGDGKEVDLIELFLQIFNPTQQLIMQILSVFLVHLFKNYGKPEKDLRYVSDGGEIRLSDYPVPGVSF